MHKFKFSYHRPCDQWLHMFSGFGHGQGQDNHHLGVSRSLWNHYLSSNSKVAFTQTQTVTQSVMPTLGI